MDVQPSALGQEVSDSWRLPNTRSAVSADAHGPRRGGRPEVDPAPPAKSNERVR